MSVYIWTEKRYQSRLSQCYSQLSWSVERGTRPVLGVVQQDVSLSLSLPRLFPRASSCGGSAEGGGGSMVRGARILRVTRVAARLDCLQRLSNWRTTREKQTISAGWRDKSIYATGLASLHCPVGQIEKVLNCFNCSLVKWTWKMNSVESSQEGKGRLNEPG